MQLVSLTLKNIRSYTNATIEFPTGIVMLSGDIGSGKSTILLAIEFALFGLLRGELSGNALLRNGTNEGFVELTFRIGDDKYTVRRTLVRTKKSVEQDAGYIVTNGIKKDATAVELKATILNLLGYPPELLTKSKNFVFRYTVYTPQEEMKRILMEDKEERVAILRKVFGIDKYERITQNAGTYAKLLRERNRASEALLADMDEKKKLLEEAKKEHAEVVEQLKIVQPQAEKARITLALSKSRLSDIEKQRLQAELLTRELHVTKSQLVSKQQQKKQAQQDFATASQQLIQLQKELPGMIVNDFSKKITEISQHIIEKEKNIRAATTKMAEFNLLKKQSTELTQKISMMANCPVCLQDVNTSHKSRIADTEQKKIQEIEKHIAQNAGLARQAEQELTQLKTELEQLRQKEKESAVARIKMQHAEELSERKAALEKQNNLIEQDIQKTSQKLAQLEQQLLPLKDIEQIYNKLKQQIDVAIMQERTHSIQHSTLMQKEQHISKTITLLENELERKQKTRKQLEKTQHVHQWLTDYFAPLMEVMEKHVMAKIHHEFDALFQQWFGMLVEDVMTARLDETFTPIIQQNGYDIEVEHLSGGERTACALAYRLALNKTINSLISSIKTKDLLILDEPTDGFSAEQLDRMRDVLDQLHLEQILVVSHEQKIESFADKVIRIAKTQHTSTIT
ncbi:MAG: SMC family ATPase [Candidatus Woesearchaeota archaeon]